MRVRVIGWSDLGVLARADGVQVRVRRRPDGSADWICRACGTFPGPGCDHLQALAHTPSDPARRWENQGGTKQ
ncbi:hypothetical protein ATK17_0837 [Branchiibius hedensis]|uniref:SWIM-type domain-containing protein n=1 Tax=Branchiibius hedensis TaxID=672460 RepID=A0A2Y9C127_9MICO|nr:hypothetical protein ATK17_0837 [Branchiibius hedensis]SSA33553.1 hypothetical protein SAMN04489750_0837 [Branchiibius hedensis]